MLLICLCDYLFFFVLYMACEKLGTNRKNNQCCSFRMSTCVYVMSSEGECEAPFRCLHEIFETVHSHNTYASSVSNQSRKATAVGVSGASSMLALVRTTPVFFFILEMYIKNHSVACTLVLGHLNISDTNWFRKGTEHLTLHCTKEEHYVSILTSSFFTCNLRRFYIRKITQCF